MKTTITLEVETKKRLQKYGKMGESYDQLINRILDECKGETK